MYCLCTTEVNYPFFCIADEAHTEKTSAAANDKRHALKLAFAAQEYVNKLAVMLLEARGNDHSAVQAQIDRLVNECSAICASLAMSNPSAIRTLHCSNFDGALMVQQGPSSSKWLSISVSSAQRCHSCYCNRAHLSLAHCKFEHSHLRFC